MSHGWRQTSSPPDHCTILVTNNIVSYSRHIKPGKIALRRSRKFVVYSGWLWLLREPNTRVYRYVIIFTEDFPPLWIVLRMPLPQLHTFMPSPSMSKMAFL